MVSIAEVYAHLSIECPSGFLQAEVVVQLLVRKVPALEREVVASATETVGKAQVVGELLWKKLRVTNSFAIHYTHQVQWNGVSLNIIGSHNFYNVGVRLATYANKIPSDGIVGEFYSIPSGFTDIKVVYKNWDVYVVFTVVQGQSVYFKYDCSTSCDIIKDISFIDESYKEIKPIAQ